MKSRTLVVLVIAGLGTAAAVTIPSLLSRRTASPGVAGILGDRPLSVPSATVPLHSASPKVPAPSSAPPAQALAFDLGVEGGLSGGVAGGVLGGVVGGLPAAPSLSEREHLSACCPREAAPDFDTEAYDRIHDNPFLAATTNPLSTFSIDVDTAAYANVRRFLASGRLPPKDAVRIEELVNYFRYDYPQPREGEPFSVTTEVAACPWKPEHRLVLVGLQGRTIEKESLPPRNLVFLIDVSGSMNDPRKLPLLKAAMGLLVDQLRPEDQVAIVVYAGASGLVLPPTPGGRKDAIRGAIAQLEAGGSTAGGAGILLAYDVAAKGFRPGALNRVILATDGDFNVGITNQGDLVRLIEEKRKTGVFLSVLGFGEGNLKDSTMEKLADSGNGNYSYIDSLMEARKVLVAEAGGTLVTIAKDVKIQVEWNPSRVAAYRLIGYENRMLRAEDFKDDAKDAGEIGAGHSVTALYEVVPVCVKIDLPSVDPLKYQETPRGAAAGGSGELSTVKLRYKQPEGNTSRPLSVAVKDANGGSPSPNLRFAASVAAFGMLLRESEHKGAATYGQVLELARGARGQDREGYRSEFVQLVSMAETLAGARRVVAISDK